MDQLIKIMSINQSELNSPDMNINNILNAANYESLCDYSIIPPEGKIFKDEILTKNAIIFCKTDYIGYLFDNIKHSKYQYILITHHSDYSIDENVFLHKPTCIKKWLAINATHKNPQLMRIPLGLKTHSGIYVEKVNDQPFYKIDWLVENSDRLKNKTKNNQIYCNWGNTNPSRNSIIDELKKKNLPFVKENGLGYLEYLESMSDFKYVISPPGNGLDCHRTWESLYLGCIPIVIKDSIYDDWADLPILQVNSYSDLNMELLNKFSKQSFRYDILHIEYWKNIIKNFE